MLTALRISNFAILEQIELTIESGFTVLTGETGAGKSLLIDAIELLMGGRASGDQIRFGEEEACLEASFDIPADHPLLTTLREQGVLGEKDTQLVVRRILSRSGRNRAYLNGILSPVHTLETLGGTLVDIHGQHDQQSLLVPSTQLEALDAFGRLRELRGRYQEQYRDWLQLCRERESLAIRARETAQRQDYLTFQRQELDDAALRLGEEEALEADRRRLKASQRLGELTAEAHARMVENGDGVLPGLAAVERLLDELAKLDQTMQEPVRLISEAKVLVREVADCLRSYAGQLEADPGRLTVIEDRLASIQRLKKKYGGTVEAALEAHRRICEELETIQRADEQLERYDTLIQERRTGMMQLANELSERRRDAARRMTTIVRQELDTLKMEQTQFQIEVFTGKQDDAYGWEGADRVEFLFSANAGEPLRPL
ncbi:MAG: AAA family ATPase, partial [Nitrospira sp.]|nr:AAA family ATPase [Nitrospira sp.]